MFRNIGLWHPSRRVPTSSMLSGPKRILPGMISLTQLHKKAPYLPDVSYQEYSQHMTIAPLNLPYPSLAPPDDAGLPMCGPSHDFAVRALHCKHSSTRKNGKMAFYAPPAFRKAPKGELLVLNGCNGKTWGGTGSGVDHHEVLMAPLNTFMKLNASNRIPILPEYAFVLCEPGSWPFQSTMDINILPEACLAYDTPAESENQLEEPASTVPQTSSGLVRNASAKARAKADPKARGLSAVPPRRVPVVRTRPHAPMQPWHPR